MGQGLAGQVLVTGGSGFIGSHLVQQLLAKGYAVTCLVRDLQQPGWLDGLNVRLVKGDCTQPESLEDAVQGASLVFHCAGLTKANHARDYYTVNHLGTRNLLEACVYFSPDLQKFILVSSQAAAGPSLNGQPLNEESSLRPVSDYGKSKLRAEAEVLGFKNRLPVAILRPSCVYGPRDRDMYELFRWASRGLMIEMAGGERHLNLCYVEDLTTALIQAAETSTESGSIYFVAENRGYSWTEFRDLLLTTGGVRARTVKLPYGVAYLSALVSELGGLISQKPALVNRQKVREAAQRYWLCGVSKIEQDLCFQTNYPLRKGLEDTWKWYRKNNWLQL